MGYFRLPTDHALPTEELFLFRARRTTIILQTNLIRDCFRIHTFQRTGCGMDDFLNYRVLAALILVPIIVAHRAD
jgi:hypothetical protein